ncbi:MAG: hypothetical protein M3Z17_10195 [Gemmatimonadota bacterium]|nr:hypothetical protein [Gemmatimonadota bacterium]
MADDRKDPVPFDPPRGKGAKQGRQKGAQQHAEGMQGPTARAKFLEQLHSGPSGTSEDTGHPHDTAGKQRLFEQREQHDEADKNSEKNRLDRDNSDHDHNRDNFQVRGGSASSRAARRDRINPTEPDAPTPGPKQNPRPKRVPGVGGS